MSALTPHIKALRALSNAYSQVTTKLKAEAERYPIGGRRRPELEALSMTTHAHAEAHALAADALEAEERERDEALRS